MYTGCTRRIVTTSKLPPSGQVHHPFGIVPPLQFPEKGQVLAVYVAHRGGEHRIVVVFRVVLIPKALFLTDEVPETSSGLGDGGEVVGIVCRVLPFKEDVHRISCNEGVAS